jgi:hypothetical protein
MKFPFSALHFKYVSTVGTGNADLPLASGHPQTLSTLGTDKIFVLFELAPGGIFLDPAGFMGPVFRGENPAKPAPHGPKPSGYGGDKGEKPLIFPIPSLWLLPAQQANHQKHQTACRQNGEHIPYGGDGLKHQSTQQRKGQAGNEKRFVQFIHRSAKHRFSPDLSDIECR